MFVLYFETWTKTTFSSRRLPGRPGFVSICLYCLRSRYNIASGKHVLWGVFSVQPMARKSAMIRLIVDDGILLIAVIQYRPAYKKHFLGLRLKTLSRATA